ncbi:MAG TPA: PH domain-containing protein [Pedococcus sp.]
MTPGSDPDGWERFHPLSPLLRGGVALLAAGAWLLSNQVEVLFGQDSDVPAGTPVPFLAGGITLVVLAALGVGWLSWRVSRFRVGATTLEVRTGLLFRQHREIRHDRIQAVDVRRPLLAQLTGLAEVRVQAAGGKGADARLAFLDLARAHDVRARLMVLAGRTDEAEAPAEEGQPTAEGSVAPGSAEGPAAPRAGRGDLVVRVPVARLLLATAYRGQSIALLLAVPALLGALALGRGGMLAFLAPAVLGLGGNTVGTLLKEWGFTLLRDRDGISARRGLTEVKTSSVPLHRVQVVSVRQPALWRFPDWWRVELNVAGVGPGSGDADTVVLPVGTRAEVARVVGLLRAAADLEVVGEALVGSGPGLTGASHDWVVAPERARWLNPVVRARHGYAVTPDAVVVRGGRVRRFAHVVPHARIQSLRLRQGPLQRALRLGTVELLSTPGQASPAVAHLDQRDAEALLNAQVVRSGRARVRVR